MGRRLRALGHFGEETKGYLKAGEEQRERARGLLYPSSGDKEVKAFFEILVLFLRIHLWEWRRRTRLGVRVYLTQLLFFHRSFCFNRSVRKSS